MGGRRKSPLTLTGRLSVLVHIHRRMHHRLWKNDAKGDVRRDVRDTLLPKKRRAVRDVSVLPPSGEAPAQARTKLISPKLNSVGKEAGSEGKLSFFHAHILNGSECIHTHTFLSLD